jgi:hypothetical protein
VFFYWVPETRKRSLEELEGQLLAISQLNVDAGTYGQRTGIAAEPAAANTGQNKTSADRSHDQYSAQDNNH